MKKFILSVCAALMLFCGGASAKVSTMKSSFDLGTSEATYRNETWEFKWTSPANNWMNLFTNLKGQASKYKHLKINLKRADNGYRLLFYKGDENVAIHKNASDLTVDLDLTKLELKDGWTIDDIDRICIAGAPTQPASGTLVLTPADVTLSTDDIETLTVTTTLDENSDVNTPFQWYKTTASGAEAITNGISNNFGKSEWSSGVLFGYSTDNKEINGYINLNGYSALRVKINLISATL